MRASAAVRARTLRASRSVSTVSCAGGDAGRLPAHNNASAACGRDTQPVMSAVLAGASDDMARATWRQETVSARAVRGAARMLDMLLPPEVLLQGDSCGGTCGKFGGTCGKFDTVYGTIAENGGRHELRLEPQSTVFFPIHPRTAQRH